MCLGRAGASLGGGRDRPVLRGGLDVDMPCVYWVFYFILFLFLIFPFGPYRWHRSAELVFVRLCPMRGRPCVMGGFPVGDLFAWAG